MALLAGSKVFTLECKSPTLALYQYWPPQSPSCTFLVCLPVSVSLCRVCMLSSPPVCIPVFRALRVSCCVPYSMAYHLVQSQIIHLYPCCCTHSLANMTLFLFHLHFHSLYQFVCILTHLYALTSLLTYTYVCLQTCLHISIHISALS